MNSRLILFVGLIICATRAFAALNVCAIANFPMPTQLTSAQVDDYKNRLQAECNLSLKYAKLQSAAEKIYKIDLRQISIYQAMRYVERYRYLDAAYNDISVPIIYQRYQSDYLKPNDQKSSEVWDNWQVGIKQLETIKNKFVAGQNFGLNELLQVHKGFYTLSLETGDFANPPYPGEVRPPNPNANPWWKIETRVEILKAQNIIQSINERYRKLDLLPDLVDPQHPYINDVLSLRPLGDVQAVYAADTRGDLMHLSLIFGFMNQMMAQARAKKHMIWKGEVFTPGQLAFFIQQYYIQVHALYEGNGRTSRFLQELILTSFGMPHGSSGDLMDKDVLSENDTYYQEAISKTSDLLDEVENCLSTNYPLAMRLNPNKNLSELGDDKLPYQCRLFTKQQVLKEANVR